MSFPLPISIPIDQLCNSNKTCENYMRSKVDSGKRPNEKIHLFEAFNFLKSLRYGKDTSSQTEARVIQILRESFFKHSPLHESQYKGWDRIEVKLDSCTDGDTCKISSFISDGEKINFNVALRLSGLDTAESNPSGKLNNVVKYTSLYLNKTYGIKNDLRPIVQERIQYIGKLAGVVTEGFRQTAKHVSIAPSFVRNTDDPAMCGTLDLIGNYGRLIARIMSGTPDQKEDLLGGFIQNVLPEIMAKKGMALYGEYRGRGQRYERQIDSLQQSKPELWKTLSPKTFSNPKEVYSKENCLILARKWAIFCKLHPEAKNDLQTMMVFIGIAPPYPKYRMHLTKLDLAAEAVAMGAVEFPGQKAMKTHGLQDDIIYKYLRPNADRNDPNASPVFIMFEEEMSGGRPLNPPDCRKR